MTAPPKSILDQSFRYTNSANTDIAKRFRQIRRVQQQLRDEALRRQQEADAEASRVVEPMRKRAGAGK